MALLWHPSLNGKLKPSQVSAWKRLDVWWLCGEGHAFRARIERVVKNQNCPACSSLEFANPHLAQEWDRDKNSGLTPLEVTEKSSRKIWWLCKSGHSWQASVYSRANGSGCGYCSGLYIQKGISDLRTLRPELASEWDHSLNVESIESTGIGSHINAYWICSNNHSYRSRVYARAQGSGCPYCAGKKVFTGFNDIATTHPEVASSWDYKENGDLKPSTVSKGSNISVYWLCSNDHSFQMSVAARTSGKNCPYCANQKILPGFNDLLTRAPHLRSEWDYLKNGSIDPSQVASAATKAKYWWICAKGHSWQASTANRAGHGTGCPQCSGHKVTVGETNLATLRPDIFREINPDLNQDVDLMQLSIASTKKVWWSCGLGHNYEATVGNRSIKGDGCPICSGRKILQGFNDLKTVNPALAKEWFDQKNYPATPDSVSPWSNKNFHWLCSNGHEWKASVNNRQKGTGCPSCAGNKLTLGVNDLASTNPFLAAEWDYTQNWPLTPANVAQFNRTPVWWFCPNGHTFRARIANRSNGTGCPNCARGGYAPGSRGTFYFIEHKILGARKVGITNPESQKDRLRKFQEHGWLLIHTITDDDGLVIQDLETAILAWIRKDLGLPVYLHKLDTPVTGGWSETFSSEGPTNHEILLQISSAFATLKGT